MKLATLLALGRVSNLPTVWTNVACGFVLGRATASDALELGFGDVLALALPAAIGTLLYTGGMFLNDAFDADFDSKVRPERPIPSGAVSRREVFRWGFGMLALGVLASFASSFLRALGVEWFPAGTDFALPAMVALTASAVIAYDRWHKQNPWAPVLMGACRAGLYGMGAVVGAGTLGFEAALAAGALWLYVIGLTHVARFENSGTLDRAWLLGALFAPCVLLIGMSLDAPWVWGLALASAAFTVRALRFTRRPGGIGRAVVALIAGMSLYDAAFIAAAGSEGLALFAVAGFLSTLLLQRWVRGT